MKRGSYKAALPVILIFSGGHREGETPDPIPNSAVKTLVADGTSHKRLEE